MIKGNLEESRDMTYMVESTLARVAMENHVGKANTPAMEKL